MMWIEDDLKQKQEKDFEQFLADRDQFKTEVGNLYNEAIGKYSADVQDENLDDSNVLETSNDEEEINPGDIPF